MALFTINNTLHQKHFFCNCKCPSPFNAFKFHHSSHFLTFSSPKHTPPPRKSALLIVRPHVGHLYAKLCTADHEPSTADMGGRTGKETGSGFSSYGSKGERVGRKSVKTHVGWAVEEKNEKRFTRERYSKKRLDSRRNGGTSSKFPSLKSESKNLVNKSLKANEKEEEKSKKGDADKVREEMEKGSKKNKVDSQEGLLRVGLEMCSKNGDVMGALELYDSALREGIELGQYHYTVLLYLCSSAALGVIRPAKSGTGSRSLDMLSPSSEVRGGVSEDLAEFGDTSKKNFGGPESKIPVSNNAMSVYSTKIHQNSPKKVLNSNRSAFEVAKDDLDGSITEMDKLSQVSNCFNQSNSQLLEGQMHLRKGVDDSTNKKEDNEIRVSEDFKKYALRRGFEIYEKMCLEKVPMNEATLTSVARMAMSMGNGDMAFDMVKQMKPLGINPRLRSYGPALSAFCNNGDIEKAFGVEEHMLEHGVYPEEPELEALLRVGIEAGKSDKVYYVLHKLRTSVRQVSHSTANLIEKWFKSNAAAAAGKGNWDQRLISEAIVNGGGGWHGQGWLGKGKWNVSHTNVGADGLCLCCGEKLATIDLDPTETEKFAESVASIAIKREKNSSFQKFQKWLDYYGPYEAVVDAANVGLFSQRRFIPSKVNAIVNGIRQMLPSKKWPLIILHNKRITGKKMDEPANRALIEKWKNADALYTTPTGSNDDWYWLYAAIKFKCLIVTNDEMRDHIFQLLGNDFFPKWKERHQVHFSFSDSGPVFHMPPPCSVIIQESENGHWHIPVASEHDSEGERTWLCVTRANSQMAKQSPSPRNKESQYPCYDKRRDIEGHLFWETGLQAAKLLKEKNSIFHLLVLNSSANFAWKRVHESTPIIPAPTHPQVQKRKGG
ncbi:hypothetical protein VitviT2T_016512 [Vitis vinifera]|uniref:ribonuclease P n=1 Tax=Vitis vinifera TaxID=29760 RepID=A0ABY9CTZ7_VITVI|nr:hypothetical protein VitviT2T_016512 [Vitis vinifera]